MANKFGVFIIGGVVGAVAALLATPRTGEQNREVVLDKVNDVLGNTQGFGSQVSASAQSVYDQAVSKGSEVLSGVASKGEEIAEDVMEKGQGVVESIHEATGDTKPVFTEKNDELRDKIEAARQRIAAQVAKNAEESAAAANSVIPTEADKVEVANEVEAAQDSVIANTTLENKQ